MTTKIKIQFSIMMFLQFFVWGLWFITMGTYLKTSLLSSDTEVGLAYGTQALGAIIAPFFVGMIADKYFSAQKILGIIHLCCALLMFFHISRGVDFSHFYPWLLTYMVLYMPTLGLVNVIAMNKMENPEKEFANIRVWGTIGWIASGLFVAYLALEQNHNLKLTYELSALFSAILGGYSFVLPNTPPQGKGQKSSWRQMLGLDALSILKDKNFLVFFICSILICIPLAFYYQETNIFLNEIKIEKAAGKMSMGQMSEMLLLFAMPFFFRYFNIKKMLLIGMCAWVLRYVFFAYGNAESGMWMLYFGIILHGICYDFFFVTGQIYTDKKAPAALRSSAQGMITLATYGIGMLIGFAVAGNIAGSYQNADGTHAWNMIWLIPAGIALVIAVIFALLFKDKK